MYKVLAISQEVTGTEDGRNTAYFEVMEYRETDLKPFVLLKASAIVTGVCR